MSTLTVGFIGRHRSLLPPRFAGTNVCAHTVPDSLNYHFANEEFRPESR